MMFHHLKIFFRIILFEKLSEYQAIRIQISLDSMPDLTGPTCVQTVFKDHRTTLVGTELVDILFSPVSVYQSDSPSQIVSNFVNSTPPTILTGSF